MSDEAKIREMVRRVVYRAVGVAPGPPSKSEGGRALVTQQDLEAVAPGGQLQIPYGALVTPLARQTAMERNVALVAVARTAPRSPVEPADAERPGARPAGAPTVPGRIAIGADHAGYDLKERIRRYLEESGYVVVDCGTDGTDSVDYPDFAFAVARLVADGRAWRGIVVDGAGIGSCMAANKVPGVRAAMCYDETTAVNSREHNHANVLSLGAGWIGESLARRIVSVWLRTPEGGDRHARRVGKIMDIERRFVRNA